MSTFLPALSILRKYDAQASSSISPFTTLYKEAPSAKLKILNQTVSPRRKYSPRFLRKTITPVKTNERVTVPNGQKSIKQFVLTSKYRINEALPKKLPG